MKKSIILFSLLAVFLTKLCAQSEDHYPVDFTFNEVSTAQPGKSFSLKVTFNLDSGWHIYAPTGVNESQGMKETKVSFQLPPGFSKSGKIKLPVSSFSGGFETYQGSKIVMEQELLVSPDVKIGEYIINGTVTFQACTDNSCLPPLSREVAFKVSVEKADGRNGEPVKPVALSFTALDGRLIDIKKMNEKLFLIDIWATWCKPCVDEFATVKRVYAKYKSKGLEVIGISADESAALPRVKKLIKDYQLTWPQFFEGKGFIQNSFIKAQGIRALPAVFLVDKDGNILNKNASGERLEQLIEKYLNN